MEKKDLRRKIKEKLASRKLHVFIVGTILITTLLVLGYLPAELFTRALIWTFGLYSVSNVGEHFAKKVESYVKVKATE